jgi:hypothetical protein
VSLVTSIPMPQLEAILAHELAHIRRHDFIINLAQSLMETLFFYHPAIWWLSHRIRIEREHCCDDLVVKLFDNGVEYGRALLAIEQLRSQRTVLALDAKDGSLLGQIRRITGRQSQQLRYFPFAATAIALTVVYAVWIAGHKAEVQALMQANISSINPDSGSEPAPTIVQANLPTGVRMKLSGVTTPIIMAEKDLKAGFAAIAAPVPNAENPDTREGWKGDGLKLKNPPTPAASLTVRKGWEDGRQFAFEISRVT